LSTIGLTGQTGGKMADRCDVLISVPARKTHEVQELHLPVYHCLCAMVEAHFFP
jgi:D-sedoheptulose 7-phosphate isomerase